MSGRVGSVADVSGHYLRWRHVVAGATAPRRLVPTARAKQTDLQTDLPFSAHNLLVAATNSSSMAPLVFAQLPRQVVVQHT